MSHMLAAGGAFGLPAIQEFQSMANERRQNSSKPLFSNMCGTEHLL